MTLTQTGFISYISIAKQNWFLLFFLLAEYKIKYFRLYNKA